MHITCPTNTGTFKLTVMSSGADGRMAANGDTLGNKGTLNAVVLHVNRGDTSTSPPPPPPPVTGGGTYDTVAAVMGTAWCSSGVKVPGIQSGDTGKRTMYAYGYDAGTFVAVSSPMVFTVQENSGNTCAGCG